MIHLEKQKAIKQIKPKKEILVTESALEEVANTEPGETGYLFFYSPLTSNEALSLTLLKRDGRKSLAPDTELDQKVLSYLPFNLDVRIAPYANLINHDDEGDFFAVSTGFYDGSSGYINTFFTIKDKRPEFYTLEKDHGFLQHPQYYLIVQNNHLLLHGSRISDIMADIQKLRNSGSVKHD
ncbi:hypothetical protein JW756_06125 [Candidatus Woesearchaeota archaeon]|nr:hypothetical protein [Candidatus Woesearchaeota archaeon]